MSVIAGTATGSSKCTATCTTSSAQVVTIECAWTRTTSFHHARRRTGARRVQRVAPCCGRGWCCSASRCRQRSSRRCSTTRHSGGTWCSGAHVHLHALRARAPTVQAPHQTTHVRAHGIHARVPGTVGTGRGRPACGHARVASVHQSVAQSPRLPRAFPAHAHAYTHADMFMPTTWCTHAPLVMRNARFGTCGCLLLVRLLPVLAPAACLATSWSRR